MGSAAQLNDVLVVVAFGTFTLSNFSATQIGSGTLATARGGTGLSSLGTAGQVVKVNSGASALEFGTLSSDFVKLNESTASNVASHSIDGFFTSDYDNYLLIGNGLQTI